MKVEKKPSPSRKTHLTPAEIARLCAMTGSMALAACAAPTLHTVPLAEWPRECPKDAIATMKRLNMHLGSIFWAQICYDEDPCLVKNGPIIGYLDDMYGPTAPVPRGTRIHGVAWVDGNRVHMAFTKARTLEGNNIYPICMIVSNGFEFGEGKDKETPAPFGQAAISGAVQVQVVNSFPPRFLWEVPEEERW